MSYSFEIGPIRPPSEAHSLLIRATRNCPWNRCKFCHTYKDERFQLRPVAEIKQDISTAKAIQDVIKELAWRNGYGTDLTQVAGAVMSNPPNESVFNVALWLHSGGENTFLQDANTLIMRTPELCEVIRFLKETFPGIKRVTSYGRSHTAMKKSLEELVALREAGLSRLHIGLESGYDPILDYMDKGVTAAAHIAGGRKVVESGISLCEYVILGLGGKEKWREHATETARVLSAIDPAFIRVRTLAVRPRMPLKEQIESGEFVQAVDEEILREERLFIEQLDCHSSYVSDHITNLLQEVEGRLPQDQAKMLAAIDRFLALSREEKAHFILGRRLGIYGTLDDTLDARKREIVGQAWLNLVHDGEIDQKTINSLMSRFI
ncbi:MAG: radical SAM protein [Chloroflexi bacterium]|nr:radical SAM protein [Chloroflexota bacterium]